MVWMKPSPSHVQCIVWIKTTNRKFPIFYFFEAYDNFKEI